MPLTQAEPGSPPLLSFNHPPSRRAGGGGVRQCPKGPSRTPRVHITSNIPTAPWWEPQAPKLRLKAVLYGFSETGGSHSSQACPLHLFGFRVGSRTKMAMSRENAFDALWSLENTCFLGRGGPRKLHSVLLGFGSIILPLAGVPQEQRDAYRGQGHDPEGCPVQLWRKTGLV